MIWARPLKIQFDGVMARKLAARLLRKTVGVVGADLQDQTKRGGAREGRDTLRHVLVWLRRAKGANTTGASWSRLITTEVSAGCSKASVVEVKQNGQGAASCASIGSPFASMGICLTPLAVQIS